jgi:hypothetical protein
MFKYIYLHIHSIGYAQYSQNNQIIILHVLMDLQVQNPRNLKNPF